MPTISLTLTQKEINELENTFKDNLVNTAPMYSQYQLRVENCVITAYDSLKVVFQGKDAEIYASKYQQTSNGFIEQAGSDEVGTGDYFGPVCVCACIVTSSDYNKIKDLDITDSKKMTDERILEIAPGLIKLLKHSLLILDNKKYNQIQPTNNLNQIKAKLHNSCYVQLKKKVGKLPSICIVDQFTPKNKYYDYIKNEKEIEKNLTFETKAESKYISVACASVIARYAFLISWEKMEEKYNMTFTKGASDKVDRNIIEFINRYGYDRLNEVAKVHFKNTQKACQ